MPNTTRLGDPLDEIHLAFVERDATPRLSMKLRIQLHLAELSLSNTFPIICGWYYLGGET